jgi:hypothetical protein
VSQRLVQADLYDITVRGTITVKAPDYRHKPHGSRYQSRWFPVRHHYWAG